MTKMIQVGKHVAISRGELLPLKGFPVGRARVINRVGDIVIVYIKTAAGITQYAADEVDGCFVPSFVMGRNDRMQTRPKIDWGKGGPPSAPANKDVRTNDTTPRQLEA